MFTSCTATTIDAATTLQVVDPKSTKEDDKKWASPETRQGIKYQVDASRRLEPRLVEPHVCL